MVPRIESFDTGGYAERRLHLLEVDSASDLDGLELGFERHSAVLLAWDTGSEADSAIGAVGEYLLAANAVSICCWGDRCDAIQERLNERILDPAPASTAYSSAIMTTAHRKESFDEALWYLLWCSIPEDQFEDSCGDMLVLTIGRPDLAIRARSALTHPEEFSANVLREGKPG